MGQNWAIVGFASGQNAGSGSHECADFFYRRHGEQRPFFRRDERGGGAGEKQHLLQTRRIRAVDAAVQHKRKAAAQESVAGAGGVNGFRIQESRA